MFLIVLTYVKPVTEIDRWMGEHVRFLRRWYKAGKFVVSGRQVPRTGGVILARGTNREELERIIREDPFHREGLADFQLIQFRASMYDPAFKPFAN